MDERLESIGPFYLDDDADTHGVAGIYIPKDFRAVWLSTFVTLSGTPTAADVDIQDDGVDAQAAIDISSNGLTTLTPFEVAAGSVIEIDLNLAGGTSPKAIGELVLWGYTGE